jgi:hypothetical protein
MARLGVVSMVVGAGQLLYRKFPFQHVVRSLKAASRFEASGAPLPQPGLTQANEAHPAPLLPQHADLQLQDAVFYCTSGAGVHERSQSIRRICIGERRKPPASSCGGTSHTVPATTLPCCPRPPPALQ